MKVNQDRVSRRTKQDLEALSIFVEPESSVALLGGGYFSFEVAASRRVVLGLNASAFAGNELPSQIEKHSSLSRIDLEVDSDLTVRVLPVPWLAIDASLGAAVRPDDDKLLTVPMASVGVALRPGAH